MTPQEFVAKWRNVKLKERSAVQSHFLDLCHLVGHPDPASDDPTGERFTFEAGASKQGGGQGWADVWKKGFFAWEYKGKHADLKKAYDQLLQYRESLVNPPLLIVSDIDTILVHTNFTNTIKLIIPITLDSLLTPEGMRNLRAIFYEPNHFKAEQTTEQVTRRAAEEFARLADHLRKGGQPSDRIAHFLIRLLFCLFAEDIELLPKGLFFRLIERGRQRTGSFDNQLRQLFGAMATGGDFGEHGIRHFNGGLFDNDTLLPLDSDGLEILHRVASLDWSNIEPSIFGTLFERSLDPSKRSQLGAHYTSKEDIQLIVEPVLMVPLRRRWEEVKRQAVGFILRRDAAQTDRTRRERQTDVENLLQGFGAELASMRILDPACGSGNFLYVALQMLLDLWKEISVFSSEQRLSMILPLPGTSPSPLQLFGIEINPYAHELAQATVWIGYIQWLHDNGFGLPSEPILKPLDNIKHMDAILAYDADGNPVEPEWPVADVIIGNPPFLGSQKMRSDLGDEYVATIHKLYKDRLPGQSDLVCYWFEKTRELIAHNQIKRAGLLATQGIRGGANRAVLEKIKKIGNIFWAQSDRNWVLDGATVHVSMIGFDNGTEKLKSLDGKIVDNINADLSTSLDLTNSIRLNENGGIAFQGPVKVGPFDIENSDAEIMLQQTNPHRLPNHEVIKPWMNASDITKRSRGKWIIDFGELSIEDASLFEAPFEYVKRNIKHIREANRDEQRKTYWWRLGRSGSELKDAKRHKTRIVLTPRVSKHRVFIWVNAELVPDSAVVAFTRDDDYFMGILHSIQHELWARRLGTQLREAESGFRYTPKSTFETFPFPWLPGQEPTNDPRVQAIAQTAKELVEKRDNWLNPPGLSDAELKKRTLTNLYNQRPTWLDLAHKKLDKAVLAAYGWSDLMTDDGINEDEVLARLLALNLERAKAQPVAQSRLIEDDAEEE
jgi:type II restriction/modification system DNA methylase subunit YeeA